MRVALIGFGSVGKAFARLLDQRKSVYPFRIVGIHTANHGTAYDPRGLGTEPAFGPQAGSVGEFLHRAQPEVVIEITTLNPDNGEPAISHIRAAISRGMHVITANKGPIAFAYGKLREEARRSQVELRFESTVMDGTPIFNQVRNNLPGVIIQGFTGALNSTSKVVLAAMARGFSMAEGVAEAQSLGITEADAGYDLEGWDSAAKAAALANVLMDAHVTPQQVKREGIQSFTTEQVVRYAQAGQTVALVSRGERTRDSIHLSVAPEVLERIDLLGTTQGTSNLLLLHTDLMGTLGILSINPGVEQTAYGLFADLIDIARSV